MLRVTHDDLVLIGEALARLDMELRAGRLDPEARGLHEIALTHGGRLVVGWNEACAVAVLRRDAPDATAGDPADGPAVVAAFESAQSGRRNLAALIVRLLAMQALAAGV